MQARDPSGIARCGHCLPNLRLAPVDTILDHIIGVSTGADAVQVRGLVEEAVSRPSQQRAVAWELDARPELLTGHAADGSPRLVALVELLVRHNVANIVAPRCPFCDRQVALTLRRDGRRCCRRYYDAPRAEACSICGKTKQVATRGAENKPICGACRRTNPIEHERCGGCGRHRLIVRRDGEQLLCHTCWRGHIAICSICGKSRPCRYAFTESPRCEKCSEKMLATEQCVQCRQLRPVHRRSPDGPLCASCGRRRDRCCRCSRTMRVVATLPDGALCGRCYKSEPAFFRRCTECEAVEHLYHFGKCQRCACPAMLGAALADTDGTVRPELEPVIRALLALPPQRVLSWLDRSGGRDVLAGLAAAKKPVTHALLDELTPAPSAARLRQILVAAGELPDRDEYLVGLQRWLDKTIPTLDNPTDRATLRRCARWVHLRRLRRASPITPGQVADVKNEVKTIIAFLTWLHDNGKCLATCRQGDIDRWLADGPRSGFLVRRFVGWAVRHRAARDIAVPSRRSDRPRAVFSETDLRWSFARKLLHDEDIDLRDRVAGLLVLLYAQHLTKIGRLTISHVTGDERGVQLELGPKPIELPPELAALVVRLERNRFRHAALSQIDDSPWLFLGGGPGTHLSAQRLATRLRKLGIPVRIGRNTALMDLATELPAAVISDLLGLSIGTATEWTTVAGNTHNGYAAEIARGQN